MEQPQFYTVEELAQMLRVAPQTVRYWIQQGKLETYRFGRAHRIHRDEVERLLRDARQPARRVREASETGGTDEDQP